ncbi:MAG: CoA transferase subunit A [Firmicutes bacterium]|nr:CoA transferase subunit A [Bacillota bacterium]
MSKVRTVEQALDPLEDGMTVMFGGFLAVGCPARLVEGIIRKGTRNLTVIVNDTAFPDRGYGRLFATRQVRKVICCYTGLNQDSVSQKVEGTLEVELCPQGTLVERIRAGGAGLGGILTPTGVGTVVEEGKERITVGGRTYLLELPLRADIAFLRAHLADTGGNLVYRGTARNFNPVMALAADYVVAEADHILAAGSIDPDRVMTPGILVDAVVGVK